MTLRADPSTEESRPTFAALKVKPAQAHLIAPNAPWLANSAEEPFAFSYGLSENGAAVGLFSLVDTRLLPEDEDMDHYQPGCVYLWRFMVDGAAQGRGLGRAALRLIEDHARAMGLDGISMTTMDKGAGNALPFYLAADYHPTGRRLDDEIELLKNFDGVAYA